MSVQALRIDKLSSSSYFQLCFIPIKWNCIFFQKLSKPEDKGKCCRLIRRGRGMAAGSGLSPHISYKHWPSLVTVVISQKPEGLKFSLTRHRLLEEIIMEDRKFLGRRLVLLNFCSALITRQIPALHSSCKICRYSLKTCKYTSTACAHTHTYIHILHVS